MKQRNSIHHQVALPKIRNYEKNINLQNDSYNINSLSTKIKLNNALNEPAFNSTEYKKMKIKKKREDSIGCTIFSKLRKDLANTIDMNDNIRKHYLFRNNKDFNQRQSNKMKNFNMSVEDTFSKNKFFLTSDGSYEETTNFNTATNEEKPHPIKRESLILDTDENVSLNKSSVMDVTKKKGSVMSITNKKKKQRIRTFKVSFLKNYNKKNKYNSILPPAIVQDIDFQSGYISDQIKVLLDNIESLRFCLFNSPYMLDMFKGISSSCQEEINLLLEETSGMMLEIASIILSDFAKYLEKYISILPPSKERLKACYVKSEENAFIVNIKLFTEISMYFKGCYEVYLVLLKQEDDISLPFLKFMEVSQYLDRSRANISSLIFRSKAYINNYKEDKEMYEKYLTDKFQFMNKVSSNKQTQNSENIEMMTVISKPNLVSKHPRRFNPADRYRIVETEKPKRKKFHSLKYHTNLKVVPDREKLDLAEKIRRQFKYKLNENTQRTKKLSNLLTGKSEEESNSFFFKLKTGEKQDSSCLNSNLINKLMKFIPTELKHQIISQRIIERFKEKNQFSEDFDN